MTDAADRKLSGRLQGAPAMVVVSVALAMAFAIGTLPSPLYPLYGDDFGFSKLILTLIYGVYAVGNLAALAFFGRFSDQFGRKITSLAAVCVGLVAATLFYLASGTAWLFAARLMSGLFTGMVSGTAASWIAELHPRGDRKAAAGVAVTANFIGLAVGPLMAGALADWAPGPLRLSYVVYFPLLLVSGAALLLVSETVKERADRLRDVEMKPRFGVPKDLRARFFPPTATAFATFALIGFYGGLIPGLLRDRLHVNSTAICGMLLFGFFIVSAVTSRTIGKLKSETVMLAALAALPIGLALLVAADIGRSMPLLLAAAAIGGIVASLGYRGSLEVINELAPDEQRGEIVSSFLIACFAGNSVPVIGIGLLSLAVNSTTAHAAFAVVIVLLAIAAAAVRYVSSRGD